MALRGGLRVQSGLGAARAVLDWLSTVGSSGGRLSDAAQVYPRQQVNQICRVLEGEGVVRRYPGPDGKLLNELIDTDITLICGER